MNKETSKSGWRGNLGREKAKPVRYKITFVEGDRMLVRVNYAVLLDCVVEQVQLV